MSDTQQSTVPIRISLIKGSRLFVLWIPVEFLFLKNVEFLDLSGLHRAEASFRTKMRKFAYVVRKLFREIPSKTRFAAAAKLRISCFY